MRAINLMAFVLCLVVMVFWYASSGYAEVYFFEDFESFSDGDDVAGKSDVWEALDDAGASGIASTKVAHIGRVSCLLEGRSWALSL